MLPKTHLICTLVRWVITPSSLSGSLRYSSYSSVYSCHLFLIVSALLGPYYFCLLLNHLFMRFSLGNSNFLDEISSVSHSIFSLSFFALITEKGFFFLSLLGIPWNSAFRWEYLFFSPLLFTFHFFTGICKASSDSHFTFLHFFSVGMVLIPVSCTMSRTSVHSSSGTLSIRSSPLDLFLTSTV